MKTILLLQLPKNRNKQLQDKIKQSETSFFFKTCTGCPIQLFRQVCKMLTLNIPLAYLGYILVAIMLLQVLQQHGHDFVL